MRKTVVGLLAAVLLGGFAVASVQLPPEIMADRYLVQVERLLGEKDHGGALEAMNKIVALQRDHNLTLPDEFHFKYAQVAFSAGSIQVAVDSLNQYLAAAGRAGQFYREALELLDEAEQNLPENVAVRYLAEAERLVVEKNYRAATDLVNKLHALRKKHDLKLPDKFHYVEARVAFSAGSIQVAVDSLNQYLAAAGRAGQFYREAQELLGEAEQNLPENVAVQYLAEAERLVPLNT